MKQEKLKRVPHIISGIVILLHAFERWEEEYPVYLLFMICGIVFYPWRFSIISFRFVFHWSIQRFSRPRNTENVRTIEFISIFSIGAISGLLAYSIIGGRKNKQDPENKS